MIPLPLLWSFAPVQDAAVDLPWPCAGGPRGDWTAEGPAPPDVWSVARGEHVVWRTPLPEGGQSGLAVGAGRLFLTTLAPWSPGEAARPFSKDVVGWALDERTGAVLWSVEVPGVVESPNLYAYSDASSPTPVTDGEHVWFVNACGGIACCTLDGGVVWRRTWRPWAIEDGFPFNKQFEPLLVGDWLVNLEPPDDPGTERFGWNFLRALDKRTGETAWVARDGATTYCTPVAGRTEEGRWAVLHGRGGWHGVPEVPVGLSLTSLEPGDAGETLWRWVAGTDANGEALAVPGSLGAPTWQALYVLHWDARHAYFFTHAPIESHLVLDARTGALERVQSLVHGVDLRRWDRARGEYTLLAGVNLRDLDDPSPRMSWDVERDVLVVHPAWHSNVVAGGYHWFLCSTAHGRNAAPNATRPEKRGKAGPAHCVGRVRVADGKVEYLEVPVQVVRRPGEEDRFVWGEAQRTSTVNARGIDPAAEDRSRTDGWEIPAFWASPTVVNDRVYFTTTLGVTYVLDADAEVLDEGALVGVADLGPAGETWSMSAVSYAHGRLFHRSLREVVAIGD